ncbi:MAG: glycosyltransferase [Patescibacteria group bacterium]|nr:glycosyltransferase [Patescibacteria group bacterium]
MANEKKIVIGVCAKNEENTILACLNSIHFALKKLSRRWKVFVVVNVNSSNDRTRELVNGFVNQHVSFTVINNGGNLVEAQRAVVNRFSGKYHIFIDADTLLDSETIKELVDTLEKNNSLAAAYASYIPHKNKNFIWPRIVNVVYDTQTQLQSLRYYLHGRIFITRDWYFPERQEMRDRVKKCSSILINRLSAKDQLLMVDDIFLSSYLLDKYGVHSIKQVPTAKAYYEPVHTIKDFYRGYRRRNLEMKKITELYPEFNYLLPFLNRKVNWGAFFLRSSFKVQIVWLYFIIQRWIFFLLLKLELASIIMGLNSKNFHQWVVTDTSKLYIKKTGINSKE